jgi:UDP-N-acetylmuramoyl-L-alanyl-D-glutamate--2,6-diaminopimelate ligase
VRQLLTAAGYKAASLGTLGVRSETAYDYGSMTTPDPVTLHALLADLAGAGVTHLAMEASSHGLDQHRLDNVNVQVAAFTNLSHDHLDYHKDFESYLAAKMRLFSDVLGDDGVAVINADIPEAAQILSVCQRRNIRAMTFGLKADGDAIQLKTRIAKPSGQDITIAIDGQDYDVHVPLVGDFQAMNVLCALGMIRAQGHEILDILPLIQSLRGVPGRLQYVHVDNDGAEHGAVYVDYAHTPDALEKVLGALRPHTQGRLICVVGCGGDRDRAKRPIITDDNPRTENPAPIRKAMIEEAQGALEIGDRAEAIQKAVSMMQKGDVVLLAGKGHEQGQIVGETILPFDDYKTAQSALEHKIKTGG